MTHYRDQVSSVLRVVTIRAGPRYAWLGRVDRTLPLDILESLSMPERRNHLVDALTQELYASFYTQGEPVAAHRAAREPAWAEPSFVRLLRIANRGRGRWTPGFTLERASRSSVVVRHGRLRVTADRDECSRIGPGGTVSIRTAKDMPGRSPGFYLAVGDAGDDACDLRVYWNVGPLEAPALVTALTTRLNGLDIPFQLKVADHPARFARRDSAVLYLPGEALGDAMGVRARLRHGTPAFTLQLAPGIGAAEETSDHGSFGLARCRLLAEGIVRAYERRERERPAVVERVFREHGVDVDAPYREPDRASHVL
jgi:hypothetical protein